MRELDWEEIVGLFVAVTALILHGLKILPEEFVTAATTILVALLFLRQIRTEPAIERAHASIEGVLNTTTSIEAVLRTIRSDVLDLRTSRARGTTHIFGSRKDVYAAIADMLNRMFDAPGEKHLILGALHGNSGPRVADESLIQEEFKSFREAMIRCIDAPASQWRVRHVYNIISEARLDVVAARLRGSVSADGFEAIGFYHPDSLPQLAPLVAGPEDIFIGLEDPRYDRVQKAVHIKSKEAVALATEYFNSLWDRGDRFMLRAAHGVREDEITRMRKMIQQSEQGR